MNIYEARQKNAVRIAEKINGFIDAGYKIFDEDGDIVTGRFEVTAEGDVNHLVSDRFIHGYFMNNKEFDNGMYTTIKEFNAYFEDWTFVHPKHAKSLFPKRKTTGDNVVPRS